MGSVLLGLLRSSLSSLLPMIFSWFGANALQMIFDAIDEAVETVLEKEEAKAKLTPEVTDDRRLYVLRKYFEGWKDFQKNSKGK